MAAALDGTFYVAWVNHDVKQADVMLTRFNAAGESQGSPVRKSFSAAVIVSDDRWVLQGCPVSGPSLSVDRGSGNLKVVWYAAGEGSAAGIYFAESKDKGHNFSPRELLSPETVRGTPALASHNDNSIALWQTSETAETKMRALGTTGSALSVATNAELPAAAYVKEKLFVAYIATEKEKRSIWLIRAG